VLVDFLLISPFKFLLDFLVISPFVVPADDIPVLDFFSIWFLGLLLLKIWTMLAHGTWDAPFLRAVWVSQTVLVPVTMKLVTALGVPYVLVKGLFPRFGYSDAVNSAVYHFAWLGSLAMCVLCYLAKAFCRVLVKLHDSIRDERYIIGQRLQDYTENS
jgi:E3 ubiquitin-protein ligase MARCH6